MLMQGSEDRAESLRMIRDSAAAVAPRRGDLRRVRALRFTEPGFDRTVWRQMCDMGWTGLRVSEEAGGAGLGTQEFCALAEELGAGLVPEPLIEVAMAARLLTGEHLSGVLSGETIIIPAWQEHANSLNLTEATTVTDDRVSGMKLFIRAAAGADAFLVTVPRGLAVVQRDAQGVTLKLDRTQDGGHFGTLILDRAAAEIIAGDAAPALEEATLATAAYLLGVMDRAFEITLDYLKTRQQFGRLIGSFQVLQHRAADLKIQIALTRASVAAAAITMDESKDLALRRAAVSRAKARASEAAMLVTRQAIQLHGGIGYTDEYDIGLFLRKAMVLANLYGSPALHRARFAAVAPETEED
jgi:alkylation response protein AidB-like acyl-CoA dehydrogenase